nr:DUF2155 domain-containing protein [uncultured Celeribacter sp.]
MSRTAIPTMVSALSLALMALSAPLAAQDTGSEPIQLQPLPDPSASPQLSDDLQTELDEIVITPLDEGDEAGFGTGGLSLEDLQRMPNEGFQRELRDITTEIQEDVVSASGATLRVLDRLNGTVEDIDLASGQTVTFGRIDITLGDCRYPEDNSEAEAYAYLRVQMQDSDTPVFSGWMIASSPALNAMDHPRYDVWPLACKTS